MNTKELVFKKLSPPGDKNIFSGGIIVAFLCSNPIFSLDKTFPVSILYMLEKK